MVSTTEPEIVRPTAGVAALLVAIGIGSIESTFDPGREPGRHGRARLVRLRDGRLVSVYEDPRRGRISVREIGRPGGSRRPDRRSR